MANKMDTYQLENEHPLEFIEWDDIWRQNAPDNTLPRVLMLGDSIARSYSWEFNKLTDGKIVADRLCTSKALCDKGYLTLIDYMKTQCEKYNYIIFNNGLHGFGDVAKAKYEEAYKNALLHIKKIFPEAKIFIAMTTPVRTPKKLHELKDINEVVIERNIIASKLAKEFGFDTLDLYSLLIDRPELFSENDGIHLTEEGQQLLASFVLDFLKKHEN